MTSTPTRIITITLALLALSAPVAGAMPLRDHDGVRTSSLAGSPGPKQDLRNPDQQAPARPYQDLRNPDQQAPRVPPPPVQVTKPAPVTHGGGSSPLVYILPSLVLVAMLGASVVYVRSSRPARV